MIALTLLWHIHADDNRSRAEQHLWQQPLSVTEHFPERLASSSWQFDFDEIEQMLLTVKHNEIGELIVNATTAKILQDVVIKLPSGMQDAQIQRVVFLIEKGLPGEVGQQLAKLVTGFYYLQQFALNTSEVLQDLESKEKSFQQTVLHQELYLGKAFAHKLFGKQNSVTRYLYARRRIIENTDLDQKQKQQQLLILQDRFKASEY